MGICTSTASSATRLKVAVQKGLHNSSRNLSGYKEKKLDLSLSQNLLVQSQALQYRDIAQRVSYLQNLKPSFYVQKPEQKKESSKRTIRVKVPLLDESLENSTIMKRRKEAGSLLPSMSETADNSLDDLEVNLSRLEGWPAFR